MFDGLNGLKFRTEQGVDHTITEEDGVIHDRWAQDCQAILDRNAEMAADNDGWGGKDKWCRRVASVPLVVLQDWENNGIDWKDENCAKEVMRRLSSNEYYKLRTANWQL